MKFIKNLPPSKFCDLGLGLGDLVENMVQIYSLIRNVLNSRRRPGVSVVIEGEVSIDVVLITWDQNFLSRCQSLSWYAILHFTFICKLH